MANQPPLTDDQNLNSWMYEITQEVNQTVGQVGVVSTALGGIGGATSVNAVTLQLYKSYAEDTLPASEDITVATRYTYATGDLEDTNGGEDFDGWSRTIVRDDTKPFVFVIQVNIADTASVENIAADTWSTPALVFGNGDSYKTIDLYTSATSQPRYTGDNLDIPGGTQGFDAATGDAVNITIATTETPSVVTPWTTEIPDAVENEVRWRISLTLVQPGTAGNWEPSDATPAWSNPFQLNGVDGADGQDGNGVEYVFAQTASTVTSIPANQLPSNEWGFDEPEAVNGLTWYDGAPTLTDELPVLWRAQRGVPGSPAVGDGPTDDYTDWTTPVIVGVYGIDGANGVDGNGIEYVFAQTARTVTAIPNTQLPSNDWAFDSPVAVGGLTWYDGAPDLTNAMAKLWRSQRSVPGTPAVGDGPTDDYGDWSTPAVVGVFGPAGDAFREIRLYQRAATQPTAPASTAAGTAFNAATGVALAQGTWATTTPSGTDTLWLATLEITQPNSEGNWTETTPASTWEISQAGEAGEDGQDGARTVIIRIWADRDDDAVPAVPQSATITWANIGTDNATLAIVNPIAGNIPDYGWSINSPTLEADGSTTAYFLDVEFVETVGTATSVVTNFATPQRLINFDGIVTFTNTGGLTDGTLSYDAAEDINNNTTTINGGQITTGTVMAAQIDTEDLFAQTITASGTITGGSFNGGTFNGMRFKIGSFKSEVDDDMQIYFNGDSSTNTDNIKRDTEGRYFNRAYNSTAVLADPGTQQGQQTDPFTLLMGVAISHVGPDTGLRDINTPRITASDHFIFNRDNAYDGVEYFTYFAWGF